MKRTSFKLTTALIVIGLVQAACAKPQMTLALGVNPFNGATMTSAVELRQYFNGIIETEAVAGFWIDDEDKIYYDESNWTLDDAPVVGYAETYYREYQWSDIYGGIRFSFGKVREVIPFWLRLGGGLTYHYAWPIEDYRGYKFRDGVGQFRPLLFMQGRIKAGNTEFVIIEPELMFRQGSWGHTKRLDHNSAALKSYYFDEHIFMLKVGYRFDI
jgi:hypothetical protein